MVGDALGDVLGEALGGTLGDALGDVLGDALGEHVGMGKDQYPVAADGQRVLAENESWITHLLQLLSEVAP